MKNILSYYYNLHPEEISYKDNKYTFNYLDNKYVFEPVYRPLNDIYSLYEINRKMISKNILVHEIILNNEKNIITYVKEVPYILLEVFINPKACIKLSDICYINNGTIDFNCNKTLERFNWVKLWEIKNDFFESQVGEIGKKYPNLCNFINYYIGLAENAISYVRNVFKLDEIAIKCICHKRIKKEDSLYDLYHPLNFVCDFRIRDTSEYIKSVFFSGEDSFNLVEEFFANNYISYKEALLFYGRLLYPSCFFDLYDDIINKNLDENIIEKIIIKAEKYEEFLCNVHLFLSKIYGRYIPQLDWLIKKRF